MQLRNRYYTYPVLAAGNEAYIDSSFRTKIDISVEGYNVKFACTAELKNSELEAMLQNGSVVIAYHVECPQTCYRKVTTTTDYNHEFIIRDNEINGQIQICTFLVALQNIDKYTNSLLSQDYKGIKFDIEKGAILAIGDQTSVTINKIRYDLVDKSSVFSIVPNTDEAVSELKVDISKDKIVILLPRIAFNVYSIKQEDLEYQTVLHSMILVPAIMQALYELREAGNDLYLYEDKRWFKSISNACEGLNIKFDQEGIAAMDIFEVSQKLLSGPIVKSLESVE